MPASDKMVATKNVMGATASQQLILGQIIFLLLLGVSLHLRLGQYPHQKDIISYPYPWAKKDIISYQYPQKIRDIYHILYHILFWRENLNGIGITHILYAVMTT